MSDRSRGRIAMAAGNRPRATGRSRSSGPPSKGQTTASLRVRLSSAGLSLCVAMSALGQTPQAPLAPPGKLVDLGGYRVHLWCLGPTNPNAPTVVLSAGGGDFATDWSLVQRPLADSVRVCSYDRPGY